jgi:hypothetical protein
MMSYSERSADLWVGKCLDGSGRYNSKRDSTDLEIHLK